MDQPTEQNLKEQMQPAEEPTERKKPDHSTVVVLKTKPETVIEDYVRAQEMAGISGASGLSVISGAVSRKRKMRSAEAMALNVIPYSLLIALSGAQKRHR